MPKPTAAELHRIISEVARPDVERIGHAIRTIERMFEAWEDDAAERERGRKALEILNRWGRPVHASNCPYWGDVLECTCGLDEAMEAIRAVSSVTEWRPSDKEIDEAVREAIDAAAASREDVTASSEDEDMEQWNATQRERRDAFMRGAIYYVGTFADEAALADARRAAAARYPLKKRVPATCDDPHISGGRWRLEAESGQTHASFRYLAPFGDTAGEWTDCPKHFAWTAARISALAELLKSPWSIEEDTNPEETT